MSCGGCGTPNGIFPNRCLILLAYLCGAVVTSFNHEFVNAWSPSLGCRTDLKTNLMCRYRGLDMDLLEVASGSVVQRWSSALVDGVVKAEHALVMKSNYWMKGMVERLQRRKSALTFESLGSAMAFHLHACGKSVLGSLGIRGNLLVCKECKSPPI